MTPFVSVASNITKIIGKINVDFKSPMTVEFEIFVPSRQWSHHHYTAKLAALGPFLSHLTTSWRRNSFAFVVNNRR